jgi:glycosyltransferase involved in cell wall biosynthesis
MRVLVAHPGLQHSHQLAAAMEEADHLAAYWSGVPVTDSAAQKPEVWSLLRRATPAVPVRANRRRHPVWFPLLRRAAAALLPLGAANSYNHRLDYAFDKWVAPRVHHLQPDIVVCYENAALETFRAARSIGATCVLDAASVHYATARSWGDGAVRGNPMWIDRRKQSEIDMADAILTCSDLAADTYRIAGVANERLYSVPLGATLPTALTRTTQPGQMCRFVFAGTLRRLKGVDILLDVFAEFEKEGAPAQLTMIGGGVEPDLITRARALSNVSVFPFLSQKQLFEEIQRHDCLVLPSRFDGFGMVVAEAMAVGVPALVTDRVGAKCIIEQHPGAGWIVGCNALELKLRMRALMADRSTLACATDSARLAAQAYTWPKYRERARHALQRIHAQHETKSA